MSMPNPEYRALDPAGAPPALTPADSPSDPAGFASVTPHGRGPAPYDLFDPRANDDLSGAVAAAGHLAGAGVVYPQGPRQAATETLLSSPQGFSAGDGTSGYDITAGYSGGGGGDWPNDIEPNLYNTPDQGQMGTFPQGQTGTD